MIFQQFLLVFQITLALSKPRWKIYWCLKIDLGVSALANRQMHRVHGCYALTTEVNEWFDSSTTVDKTILL